MNQKKKIKLIASIIIWSIILIMLASIILKIYNINLEKNTKGAKPLSEDFILTSHVNINAANGKGGVDLDWSSYDATNKIFKAYQKKEGADEFETISTIDFYNEVEPIKILNIYPIAQSYNIPTVTFRYLDGTNSNLPKSASLKIWMEGGTMTEGSNIITFEAYGKNPITGQQVLKVTPMSIPEFNANPEMIWNYDILMQGTWDGNGTTDKATNMCNILNDNTTNEIEKYIREGYGVLTGHDLMGFVWYNKGMNKLRRYFNIEIGRFFNHYPENMNEIDRDEKWAYGSTSVRINKQGTITNFPYKLSKNIKLTVPFTHTTSNAALGNVWITLIDGIDGAILPTWVVGADHYVENYKGTGNPYYYLTTWNNTAMIQTGSSNCKTTEDERKILANTLFYLKQRTTATAFTDNSAQDLKAPDAPITKMERIDDSNLQVTLNAEDIGNEYTYYIEALDANNAANVIATSNQVTETVETGTKGYYYVIDNSKTNTNFDIERGTYTENANVTLNMSNVRKIYTCKSNRWSGECK